MPTSDYLSRETREGRRVTPALTISAVGGVLILAQSLLIIGYGESSIFYTLESGLAPTLQSGIGIGLLGLFGVFIGVSVILGAYLMSSPALEIIGGIVVLIFSIVSIVIGGGWLVGLALGLIGALLGLLRR